MSDITTKNPLTLAIGAAFASALTVGVAGAAENPFGQSDLAGGYMIADNHADKAAMEGKCGEGKCGAAMNKATKDGQSGAQDKAMSEGMCGAIGKAQKQGDKAATPETPDNSGNTGMPE